MFSICLLSSYFWPIRTLLQRFTPCPCPDQCYYSCHLICQSFSQFFENSKKKNNTVENTQKTSNQLYTETRPDRRPVSQPRPACAPPPSVQSCLTLMWAEPGCSSLNHMTSHLYVVLLGIGLSHHPFHLLFLPTKTIPTTCR